MEPLSLEGFAARAAEFDQWVRRCPDIDTFCSSSDWILPAAAELMPPREPFLWRGPSGWVAMMRGTHHQGWRYLEPLEASWGLACPLIGTDPEAIAADFAQLVRRTESEWDVLLLSGVPSSSRLRAQLDRRLGAHYDLTQQSSTQRHVADLRGGVDGFLSRRTRNFRRSLQRSRRRAQQAGIDFEPVRPIDGAAADALFERTLAIERCSWKGRAGLGIDTPGFGDFYRSMLRRLALRGALRARVARQDGRDVGFVLGGVLDRGYRGLQMSYDERLRPVGLGNLLQWEEIADLCAEGFDSYDLGTGLEYKLRWAEATLSSDVLIVLKVS
ncbi:MAG TPA: GNAT family N-acetyltransferase [Kofleriaceae bacterium]|jgi:CelD/BcsL family acetyltransferase involved in cellulose biosynthesis|nr:GNAT family N-acetyltransferase [Kofleriaceae bacterium]